MAPQPPLHPPHAFESFRGLPPGVGEPSRFSSNPTFDQAFLMAAFKGDLRRVKQAARALGRGAEGRRLAEKMGSVMDGSGMRLIHLAALGGSLPVCRYLLEDLGLNVDVDGPSGETAIEAAIARENVELVRYFLDQGADTEKLDKKGCTLLHFACKVALVLATIERSMKCVKLLLEAGADVDGIGKEKPLMIAATAGSTDFLKCLVLAGADANVTDTYGRTPIEIVALSRRREDVEILFPFTSRLSNVRDWSVDGVIGHVISAPPAKAMLLDPGNAPLLSNRSLCWLRFGDARKALSDAQLCRMMRPGWPKACYREGTALMLLKDYEKACGAFLEGVKLEPWNTEIEEGLRYEQPIVNILTVRIEICREALESLKTSGSSTGKDLLDQHQLVGTVN
ncbi:hypothetical protein ACQ4PT_011479 [Festuca glaucescens]